nr:MAG TPA: hypothetical protein [Caudoviricetes sp.]
MREAFSTNTLLYHYVKKVSSRKNNIINICHLRLLFISLQYQSSIALLSCRV